MGPSDQGLSFGPRTIYRYCLTSAPILRSLDRYRLKPLGCTVIISMNC
jgi:hypothetical protein